MTFFNIFQLKAIFSKNVSNQCHLIIMYFFSQQLNVSFDCFFFIIQVYITNFEYCRQKLYHPINNNTYPIQGFLFTHSFGLLQDPHKVIFTVFLLNVFSSFKSCNDKILKNAAINFTSVEIQYIVCHLFCWQKIKNDKLCNGSEKKNNYALILLRKNQNCLDDMSIYKCFKNLNGSVSITVYTAIFF